MTFNLGPKSRLRLADVDPRLVAVVQRAIGLSTQDFTVIEGRRSLARQKELYAQGRTKPGPVVTWTMKSKHIDGLAVDLAPWVNGAIDWNTASRFDAIYTAMMRAASELGTPIRSGMDWDRDGIKREAKESDSPHWELAG